MLCEGCSRISIVQHFRMDERKRFEYVTCGHVFFGKRREKNLRFQTKTYTCGRGLSLLGNGNGKAINFTISVRTRAQSLPFSSNPNSLQSTGPLGKSQKKWNNEKSIFSATFSWTSLLSDRKVPKISLGRSEFLKKISSLSWDKW